MKGLWYPAAVIVSLLWFFGVIEIAGIVIDSIRRVISPRKF